LPAWAVTVIEMSSISITWSSDRRSITMPPWMGSAPPCVPDPPPHGTTGMRCSDAIASTVATSSSVRGRTTTSGRANGAPAAFACNAGQYVSAVYPSRSAGAVVTAPSPSAEDSAASTSASAPWEIVVMNAFQDIS
jgi:hypothetical protein